MEMKKIGLSILSVLLVISLVACSNEEEKKSQTDSDSEQRLNINIEEEAARFVGDLMTGKYEDAINSYVFDEKMKSAISPIMLDSTMKQLFDSVGSYVKIDKTTKTLKETYDIISVVTIFEKETLNINVVFNKNKEIAGFNYTKYEEKTENQENAVIPENIREAEVLVGEGEWELPGTLTLPKGEGPFPAVVLVHGSGPSDRDETIGPNKPFRDIAWGLAQEGVAVLRYEKRTKHYEKQLLKDINEVTVKEEAIDDSLEAVQLLRDHRLIKNDNIYVLGHSLGGYLVPRIGIADEGIAGFIILAGGTRPLEDIIVEQVEYLALLDGDMSSTEKEQLNSLKEARLKVKSENLNIDTNPKEIMGVNAKYWLDLREYSPADLAKELNRPLFILQGERDYQVTMEDFNNWKAALGNDDEVTFKSYEGLNHLLMDGEGQSTPNEYTQPGKVSKEVIKDVSEWILSLN